MEIAHIIELDRILKNRRTPIPLEDILKKLECSKSTFHRIQRDMLDYLGAPIKNIKSQGYYYDLAEGEHFELPGLWFSPQEIIALSLLEQLSESFQPAVIQKILAPLHKRLDRLLEQQQITPQNWQTDTKQKRCISPQRIIYYRDNWYLDAWCHLRQALRTFSIDAIKKTQKIDQKAIDISPEELNEHVLQGYGIFAGKVTGHARLKFSKEISSRVSRENWHPDQVDRLTLHANKIVG